MNIRVWLLVGSAVTVSALLWWWGTRDYDERAVVVEPPAIVATRSPVVTSPSTVQPSEAPSTPAAPPPTPARSIPTEAPPTIDEYKEWQRDLIEGLIQLGTADSLLAAALILHALYAGDPADAQKLRMVLLRAHQLAPGDRTIAAIALRICGKLSECNAERYVKAVRNIDASNALGKIDEVLFFVEKGEPTKAIEELQSIQRLRLELYNSDALARTARALLGVPTSPRFSPSTPELARLRSELALRAVKAVALPAYSAMIPFCQSDDWRRRQQCDATIRELSRSESMDLQRTGIAITRSSQRGSKIRLAEADDAEAYLSWVRGTVANSSPPAEQWIELLAQRRTELDASLAWLELQGVPPRRAPTWFRYR